MDGDKIRQKYADMSLSLSLIDEDLLSDLGYGEEEKAAILAKLSKPKPQDSSDPETGDDSSPEPDPPEQP